MTELWLFDAEWTNASLLVMLHFMWQATLVMLVAWGIASLGRSLGGRFQYGLWLCAYFSLPCFVLGTIVAVDLPAKVLRAIEAQRMAATSTDRDQVAGDRALLANRAATSGNTRLTDPRIVEDPSEAARSNAPGSMIVVGNESIESSMIGQPVGPAVEPRNELEVADVEPVCTCRYFLHGCAVAAGLHSQPSTLCC